MNLLQKTLPKTPKSTIFFPLIVPINLNPFSLSSQYSTWSTKLLYNNDSKPPVVSPMEENQTNTTSSFNSYEGSQNKKLTKPSEIPYQTKVANWVNFVGTVKKPVQFCTSVDGKSWATTFIYQHKHLFGGLPLIGIPIIFEGDLAHTAATHLKENEIIYVAGHLSPNPLPIKLTNAHVKLKVLVHDFYYVRRFPGMKVRLPGS